MTVENTSTPVEIALREVDPLDVVERAEVVVILGEFTEIPDSMKFELLSKLNNWNNKEETKEQFRKLLSSVPVQLVRAKIWHFLSLNSIQVNTSNARYGTLLQYAVKEDNPDFVRILMDGGFVSCLNNGIHNDKILGRW